MTHTKQFLDVTAYNDYYNIMVYTSEISVDQIAMQVQSLLVEYLRASYGHDTANWYERF
jgi:hypothetical protein